MAQPSIKNTNIMKMLARAMLHGSPKEAKEAFWTLGTLEIKPMQINQSDDTILLLWMEKLKMGRSAFIRVGFDDVIHFHWSQHFNPSPGILFNKTFKIDSPLFKEVSCVIFHLNTLYHIFDVTRLECILKAPTTSSVLAWSMHRPICSCQSVTG